MKKRWLSDLQLADHLRRRKLSFAPTKNARQRVYQAARILGLEVKCSSREDGKGFDVKYISI